MSASRLHYRRLRGGLKASTKLSGRPYSLQIRSQVSNRRKHRIGLLACVLGTGRAQSHRV